MRASYRLQLRGGMDLDGARRLVPYLERLGISHLYLSPLFRARSGSLHGYDVTDPLSVEPALGGEPALARLAHALHARGLGLLLDIVPNHQAADPENPHFADVLRLGRGSRFANWFDVDWGRAGRLVLPVLRDVPETLVARGELALVRERGEPQLSVHGRLFPLAPATRAEAAALLRAKRPAAAAVLRLLDRQAYRLLPWRSGKRALNYRRFFDIDELIAVRCEDPAVFEATHAALFRWVAQELVDGVRVDHVDGLADPAGYLARLRAGLDARRPAPRLPIYVEKILAHDEALPARWPVAGTTGYEFAASLDAAGVSPSGAEALRRFWRAFTGERADFVSVARASKREVLRALFPAELAALVRALGEALAEAGVAAPGGGALRAALVEAIAALGVYRTYADPSGRLGAGDRARWRAALREARRARPRLGRALDALGRVLLDARRGAARARFVSRLERLTGPVAAKGVEDTALYRSFAVPSLSEVGGDPEAPRGDALAALHRANAARLRSWPGALLAATTHDTKRSADVRARLAALTAHPALWSDSVRRWHRRNARLRRRVAGRPAPEPAAELALYQALVGLWPPLAAGDPPAARARRALAARLAEWSRKAAREAKRRTRWTEPDARYEQALARFVAGLLADRRGFLVDFAEVARQLTAEGAAAALARRLVQLTAPGVPDLYQADELGLFALVDPDNRRLPELARARRRLAEHVGRPAAARAAAFARLARRPGDERATLWLTHAALTLRRREPRLFARGTYRPLAVEGASARGWLAYLRRAGATLVLVAARLYLEPEPGPRAARRQAGRSPVRREPQADEVTMVRLPRALAGARLRCALSGRRVRLPAPRVPLERLTGSMPFALLTGRVEARGR